jgi:hypothetical protein
MHSTFFFADAFCENTAMASNTIAGHHYIDQEVNYQLHTSVCHKAEPTAAASIRHQ